MEEVEPIIVDRSTAENFATCPWMARLRASRMKSVDAIAESGDAIHKVVSAAIREYVTSKGSLTKPELAELMDRDLMATRTDLLEDAVRGFQPSKWAMADYITGVHPSNVLAFDGGEDTFITEDVSDGDVKKPVRRSLSGQIYADVQFGRATIRLTCEVDYLYATRSEGLLNLDDWKTGWKQWTEKSIAESFQFNFYAFLVLETYPDIDAVDVMVWNLRTNRRTFRVRFYRKDMEVTRTKILSAAGDVFQFGTVDMARVEFRPTREGCRLCSCAAECPVCDRDISEIKADPIAAVDRLYAIERKAEEYRKTLNTICAADGDIVTPSGNAFGFGRVKKTRKPKCELYATAATAESSEDEE